MEIKKGLTFAMALQNIKDNGKAFCGAIVGAPLLIYLFIALADQRVISEKMAIVMAQALFIGVIFFLWGVICGKYPKSGR